MDRRALAPERDAARQRCRRAAEFSDHCTKADGAVSGKQRGLRLRNAAASGLREVSIKKISRDQRANDGSDQPPPCRAIRRIQAQAGALGYDNECHDGETDDGPDDQCEDQE